VHPPPIQGRAPIPRTPLNPLKTEKIRIEKIRKDKIKIGGMRGEMRVKLKMKVRIKRWWKLSKTAHLLRKYGVIELLEILMFGLILILLARIFG